ncbi:MAG: HD-GYP domain-containing protein [Planctomycetes bacterium]|nr:HD-GYP domain-containing protein [Planctomycetota bacterium]
MTKAATTTRDYTTIPLEQLRVGAVLQAPILDGRHHPSVLLLAEGTKLTSRLLRRLWQRGVREVRVRQDELVRVSRPPRPGNPPQPAKTAAARSLPGTSGNQHRLGARFQKVDQNSFLHKLRPCEAAPPNEDDVAKFSDSYEQSLRQLDGLFECLASRESITTRDFRHISEQALVELARDKDLFVTLGIRPEHDSYPSRHCLQTAMLAMAVGTMLGLPEKTLLDLGLGCLVHDAGMSHIDPSIVQARRKLNELEFIEITKHPSVTFDLLREVDDLPNASRMVIYQSHERCNGTGYPRHRRRDQIHYLARIAAVADVYVALVSPRPHRPGMLPYFAAEQLVRDAHDGLFDPNVVRALLTAVSLFPLGSYIELNDGRVGKVIRANGPAYTRPVVQVWQPDRLHEAPAIVDLRDTPELHVRRPLPDLLPPAHEADLDLWE